MNLIELPPHPDPDIDEKARLFVERRKSGEKRRDNFLRDLECSTRAFNVIWRARCGSFEEMTAVSREEWLGFHNCGRKTLTEIEQMLAERGFQLRRTRTPTPVAEWRCQCGKRFRTRNAALECHPPTVMYRCSICDREYGHKQSVAECKCAGDPQPVVHSR